MQDSKHNSQKIANKSQPKSVTDKIEQLDHEIEWFYGDDFRLDEAIKKYEAASQLASEIDQSLTELKNQVEVIADFTKS